MEKINIFIPTKNRVDNSTLLKFAEDNNQIITAVVEPQDYENYKAKYSNFNYYLDFFTDLRYK